MSNVKAKGTARDADSAAATAVVAEATEASAAGTAEAGPQGDEAAEAAAAETAAAAAQRQAAVRRILDMIGEVATLAMTAPSHRHLFLSDLEWLVVPAVESGQCRLFRRNSLPFAYASWALVSEEVEQRLASGIYKLKPSEWRSGDRLWLMDFIAPPAEAQNIVATLKKTVFEGKTVKTVRPNPDGQGMVVAEW